MSFLRSVFSVSVLTVVTRLTGYMRDLLLANLVGANAISDAITISIKIPSFFRRIFAEGAFHVSFLPAYTHAQKSKVFAGMVLSLLLGFLGCFVLAVEWHFPAISVLIVGDKKPVILGYVQQFGPIVFPYIFFISTVSFFGSILNAHKRFSALAISQAIGNISVITFVWTLAGWTSQTGLLFAWGVLLSGIIQCGFILITCWKKGYLIPMILPRWTPEIRTFLKRFLPGLFSVSVSQINVLIVPLLLIKFLPEGSISYLGYADRLNQLPLSIIGIALSSVLLPLITEKIQKNDTEGADIMLSQALRFAWLLALPAIILMSCCALPLVLTLFGNNSKLTPDQLHTIADTVRMYALGMPAYIFIKIFNARFFAARDTTSPLLGGIMGALSDIFIAVLLVGSMQHLAVALAASLSSWCNALFLMKRLHTRKGFSFSPVLKTFYIKSTVSALFSALIVVGICFSLGSFASMVLWHKIGSVILIMAGCAISFVFGLWVSGLASFGKVGQIITSFRKKNHD
jgi:putative peptidoglycan lipid II flippase